MTNIISGANSSPEDLELPLKIRSVVLIKDDLVKMNTEASECKPCQPQHDKSTTTIVTRKLAGAPASPIPNPLKIMHRRISSVASTRSSGCSSYAGPQPLGPDGRPLKSCLKSLSSTPSLSSDGSLRSSFGCGRRVTFSHVQLREYCRQIGDNPSVSCGCPLAIGWRYNKRGTVDIDSYEADLDKDPRPCRRLSPEDREKILTEIGGASHAKIMQAQVQAYFDRQLRAETLDQIGGLNNYKSIGPRERLFIMKESAARKLDRAKRGTSNNQEQQNLWYNAHQEARRKSLDSSHTSREPLLPQDGIGRTV